MNGICVVILGVIFALGIACAVGVAAGVIERKLQEEFDEDEPYRKKHYINTREEPHDEDHRNR